MKQQSAYPLQIDETLQKRVKQIAKENERTYRAQIENILKTLLPTTKRSMVKSKSIRPKLPKMY